MQNHKHYLLIFLILFGFSSISYGQGVSISDRNLPSLRDKVKEPFVSIAGKFSINLPKQIKEYKPIANKVAVGILQGHSFGWSMAEDISIIITYTKIELKPMTITPLSNSQFFDIMRDTYIANGFKFVSEKDLSLSGYSGRELTLENEKFIIFKHDYKDGRTFYQIAAVLPKEKPENVEIIKKILGSFKILTQTEVDKEVHRKVDAATPAPLPQVTNVKRQKSEAEDFGLKGRVKNVTEEIEYFEETSTTKRMVSLNGTFDQNGNFTKRMFFDDNGNPWCVMVFGYINGERVAKAGFISYEYDPPAQTIIPPASTQSRLKYDTRYTTKFAPNKYDEKGRIVEESRYSNNGMLERKCTSTYIDNQVERQCFDKDNKLKSKNMFLSDSKGNVVEWTDFDITNNKETVKYFYMNEFDINRNWIKRTITKHVIKDGVKSTEPYSVQYRTIIYY